MYEGSYGVPPLPKNDDLKIYRIKGTCRWCHKKTQINGFERCKECQNHYAQSIHRPKQGRY